MTNILVFVTTSTKREAQEIVQSLLRKRLIACANITNPVESHYWWQDKIEETKETLVIMKTKQNLFPKVAQAAKNLHSYDVPEILAVPIVEGYQPYLKWLDATLGGSGE